MAAESAHRPPRRHSFRWLLTMLVFAGAVVFTFPLLLPSGTTAVVHAGHTDGTTHPAPTGLASGAGAITLFQANLSGAAEAPPAGPVTDTEASGWAIMALTGNSLYYRVMVNNISDITAAHIHTGTVGASGPVAHPLFTGEGAFDPQSPVSGTITLGPGQVDALLAGAYYVNVHTTSNPGGEIRGQLEAWTPPASYNALLLGSNEVPARETDAEGLARFTLSGSSLTYEITVRDIMSITMSHIHRAPAGVNGGVVHWLWGDEGETRPFGPGDPISGTISGLTGQDMVDLLTGYYYVNVHTESYPGGELRGQIGGARPFEAVLNGNNEVGPVETAATGRAVVALSGDATTLHYRISVNDIMSITMSHIHRAPAGANGPVVHWLYDGSVPFDETYPVSGTVAVTPTSVLDLISGDYYVNVHTQEHPAGEIRGQLMPFTPNGRYVVSLSGAQEVPPRETGASGVAELTLDLTVNRLHYQVEVSNIMSITASHFHEQMRGVNGPVRHWLFPHAPDRPGTIDNDLFAPGEPVGGGIYLDGDSLLDLLSNFYYVNVHTERYPGGELRGQVITDPTVPTAVGLVSLETGARGPALPVALGALVMCGLAGALVMRRRFS